MPPESDSPSRDAQRRQIQRILAAGRARPRRLRALDIVLLGLVAGHLLVDNLSPGPAASAACPAPPDFEFRLE